MSLYTDAEGNLWALPVPVIARHSPAVELFWIGNAHAAVQPGAGDEWRPLVGTGGEFLGGNGRNWRLASATPGVQGGWYAPTAPDTWASVRDSAWTWARLGDGTMELSDGVDVVAASAAVGSGLTGSASAGTFAVTTWSLIAEGADYKIFQAASDPDTQLYLYKPTGDAHIYVTGSVIIAERPGGDPDDASGVYVANGTGETDFNGGSPWSYTAAATGSTGTAGSTAYGAATYGGAFSVGVEFEGGSEFTARQVLLRAPGTTGAVADFYKPTGWQGWEAATDAAWTLRIDGSGAGEWRDATNVVAYRDADASLLYDPSGRWFSTPYGAATYGVGGADFEVTVGGIQRAVPLPGYWWGELILDAGTNKVTGTAGPKFGATWPDESPTLAVYPLAWSDGAGTVREIQTGPIHWTP